MIKNLYPKYFQKSHTFLYPLLGFNKNKHIKPEQTYINWGEYNPTDRKLICVFKKDDSDKWKNFEKNFLITHKMLHECHPIDDFTIIYVFDLSAYMTDFDNFLIGKYSRFSNAAKSALTDYYGIHTGEWVYIESFLFPKKYYKLYAEILGTDVEILEKVGELCDIPDIYKESCMIPSIEL